MRVLLGVSFHPYRSRQDGRPTARFANGRGVLFTWTDRAIQGILTLVFFLTFSSTLQAQNVRRIVQQSGPSVVTIIAFDASGSAEKQGSGVFVSSSGRILTNAHVIDGAYSLKVIASFGQFSQATIITEDKMKDLALVEVNTDSSLPVFADLKFDYQVGDPVVTIGSPMGLAGTVSQGMISGIREMQNGIELIQTTAPISPGSSGGALLNSDGKLIGITTETIRGAQNINFAVSLKTISDFALAYDSLKTHQRIQAVTLPQAGSSQWYSVVWKWVRGILLFVLALIYSPGWVILLFGVGLFLVFLVVGAVWKIFSLPFKKLTNRKLRAAEHLLDHLDVEPAKASEANGGPSEESDNSESDFAPENVLEGIHPPLVVVSLEEQTLDALLIRKLKSRGFSAVGFADKRELFEKLPSLMPDVVITDRTPPGFQGFDLAKAIKSEPKMKDIYVMPVIAHINVQAGTVAWRMGGPDFMPTPCEIDAVVGMAIWALNKSSSKKE